MGICTNMAPDDAEAVAVTPAAGSVTPISRDMSRRIAGLVQPMTRSLLSAALLMVCACQPQTDNRFVREAGPRWIAAISASGTSIRLTSEAGATVVSIACVSGGELRVTVPGFSRIGSEDRLSFGFDDDPLALAVEMDGAPSGVTGSGAIPHDMARRIASARTVAASYGSRSLGPLPPPDAAARDALARACAGFARRG